MTRSKLGMVVISSLVLVSFLFVTGSICEAQSKKSMVGLVSFSTTSNAVVGMVTSANRGMEKIISYQIPPLTGQAPYTFSTTYSLAVASEESSNQTSSMGPGNRGRSGTMMDDEDDTGDMGGEMANMRWSYDTYITLANTSAASITVDATFYDNNGTVLKQTSFNIGSHQTIQESVFELLGLR